MTASIESLAKRVKKLLGERSHPEEETAPREVRLAWHGLIDRETGKRWDERTRSLVEIENEEAADGPPNLPPRR